MSRFTVVKDGDQLRGWLDKDQRAWRKYQRVVSELGDGECLEMSVWFPRQRQFHKYHFAVLKGLFETQEFFTDMDVLRKWLYIGAGYADIVPGERGGEMAIARSIAYDKLDQAEFEELHNKIVDFMRTEYCQRTLWPHLEPHVAAETIEVLLDEFSGVKR